MVCYEVEEKTPQWKQKDRYMNMYFMFTKGRPREAFFFILSRII